ncbi:MAG: HAMP domain-containing protein [Chloroflexi bacterium]|nr:HAMP domain-containing protein [Chloroflexota bacterium]
MSFLFTLLAGFPFPILPTLAGWIVWLGLLGLTIFNIYHWRQNQAGWKAREWGIFALLLVLVPFSSLFIGVQLSSGSALPLPGLPSNHTPGSSLMLFSAIPWTLAGVLLGPVGAAVVGALAGLLRGVWDTYNLFTMLEFALLGAFFSTSVRQRYRTPAYQVTRQPFVSALLLIPFHIVLYVIGAFFSTPSSVPAAARLDFAISNAGVAALAFAGEILIAGVVCQIAVAAFPSMWGTKQQLHPSPTEQSLETRFLFGTGTFIMAMLLALLIGDWVVAGNKAGEMIQKRLASTAESAAQTVPFFLETGQNLAVQVASDPRLLEVSDPELSSIIGQRMQAAPYFDQFFILDANTNSLLGAYPSSARQDFSLFSQETLGMQLAVSKVLTQIYTIPSASPDGSTRVSFMIGIVDFTGQVRRVLIGRTTLSTNPLTQPLITSLKSIRDLNGTGLLLDENNQIIYAFSQTGNLPASFEGPPGNTPLFYPSTAGDGTRQLVYYWPVVARPWAIVLTVPAQQTQQLALDIAMPMFLMILLLAIVALVSLRIGLRVITRSLKNLAVEANRIADGKFDHPLQLTGVDEVGQLRRAFEQMRISLASRLDELNRLLVVSQGVASSLEMQDTVKPVLEAVLSTGANAVRVVLSPSILPETPVELPSRFAVGPAKDAYAYLDDKILAMAQKQERIVFPNLSRTRELTLDPKRAQPSALLAVALRHENRYYGVVWAAYEQTHNFSEADVRFVTTIAGQAALAVANARLFLNVEVARRQLEAIINSTPDPVLVTDQQNHLLLANRAAGNSLDINIKKVSGQTIEKVIKQKPLLDLLQATGEKQSAEVVLPDSRTYLATASSVVADGHSVGRVCILRDVTKFKELDTMKSEFVATVSHDLRSPLTLMRGYATMLEMVGELNDQQQNYVKKIVTGVENMSRLVNTLLDLGRIEIGVGLQLESVSVLDILERVTSALQMQAAQKEITFNVEISKDMPHTVEADQALLHQAVYNLVENAMKYTPEKGRVTVRTRTNDKALVFEVEDTGIGIEPDDLPRLFEKFYRGKQREARAQHGSGLGLAIVRSIAESHSGKVWVQSRLGMGSTFFLQIPLNQSKESKVG